MNENLKKLRAQMKKEKIDVYLLPNSDPHVSEYLGEHYKYVRFLTGFSGSNAYVVVTAKQAGLWTDGRYFIQADKELKGSGFKLFKMNVEGYPTVREFVKKETPAGGTIAFDGRLVTKKEYDGFLEDGKKNKANIRTDFYYLDEIWMKRPARSKAPIWILGKEYAGRSCAEKIKDVRRAVKKNKANSILISDLCDIAWVLNLRGDDINTVPVFYSYLYINKDEIKLFVQKKALTPESQKYLHRETADEIKIYELDKVYDELKNIKKEKVLIDEGSVNIALVNSFTECSFIHAKSPVLYMRSVKNTIEIKNIKKSHIMDGVALTKYIYELKHTYKRKNGKLTSETKVAKDLYKLRSMQEGFIGESFNTIAAYKANAAMMHYTPGPGNDAVVDREGFLLIDSGGHYLTGTTDVTRTIAMGPLTQEEKESYTTVLKAHLAMMNARFAKGSCGENLDIIARMYLWKDGKDYLCGTGHGVGYLLSVHEGVHSLRWRILNESVPFEPGMIVTDEPGYYEAGKYGIRIENELLVSKDITTEYGSFYKFVPMTFVPYEMEAVVEEMLSAEDRKRLNAYNSLVYKTLYSYLTKEEKAWLYDITQPI